MVRSVSVVQSPPERARECGVGSVKKQVGRGESFKGKVIHVYLYYIWD